LSDPGELEKSVAISDRKASRINSFPVDTIVSLSLIMTKLLEILADKVDQASLAGVCRKCKEVYRVKSEELKLRGLIP